MTRLQMENQTAVPADVGRSPDNLRLVFSMAHPYASPTSTETVDQRKTTVPYWVVQAFGALPGAIIISYLVESILYPTRGWREDDWFWAVGPPAYLLALWIFALFSHRRNSRLLIACCALLMIPLLLHSVYPARLAAGWYFHVAAEGLEGHGINENYRLFVVTVPLWLAASLACMLYFWHLVIKLLPCIGFRSSPDKSVNH